MLTRLLELLYFSVTRVTRATLVTRMTRFLGFLRMGLLVILPTSTHLVLRRRSNFSEAARGRKEKSPLTFDRHLFENCEKIILDFSMGLHQNVLVTDSSRGGTSLNSG